MATQELLDEVLSHVGQHCRQAKGYEEGPWVNPMVPSDCVSAFMMAQYLTRKETFDHYVAVAPEGHVYGYFFEQHGARVLSVHVDYPPRRCEALDDLSVLRGGRVLIIEDDCISGVTLRLVIDVLQQHNPCSLSLYLGRRKEDQQLDSIAPEIDGVFLAEDYLNLTPRDQCEAEFFSFFADRYRRPNGSP